MQTRRTALAMLASATLGASSMTGAAAAYPSKPLRWVVPYPAGGGSDFMARTVGQPLSVLAGQGVVVDNKPGGNGAIAVADVLRAAPDGHTLINVDNGTLVFNPVLYRKLGYAPDKDLRLVSLLARAPMILVVGPNHPAKDVKEFLAQARSQPGALNFGSAGAGTPQHMAMEMLMHQAGLRMTHIPYKGSAPALGDLAGGQIPAVMSDYAAAGGFLQSGKLRALAIADSKRHPRLPDVPTFSELGLPGVEATALVGVAVRANTPDAAVDALQKYIAQALADPAVRSRYLDVGLEPVGNTPQAFTQLIAAESARWTPLIRSLGITLD
ncbi:MAG: tripartite tricarboxylate transporter substrate binding protein [Comamonadaceae bacterium]|nr:MAG: tripartite tricarboxylate transporter substrate binding protein [Comamonadaceae bacterium]